MLRISIRGAACALLLLLVAVSHPGIASAAQSRSGGGVEGMTMLRVTGGLSMPSGDLGDAFETGIGLGLSVAHGVSRNVLLSGGFGYHHLDGDGFSGGTDIIPMTFNADVVFPTQGKVHPWIGGGIGAYNVDMEVDPLGLDESETNFGINLGMGLGGPMGEKTTWGAAFRYHSIFEGDTFNDLQFVTLQFGVGFLL